MSVCTPSTSVTERQDHSPAGWRSQYPEGYSDCGSHWWQHRGSSWPQVRCHHHIRYTPVCVCGVYRCLVIWNVWSVHFFMFSCASPRSTDSTHSSDSTPGQRLLLQVQLGSLSLQQWAAGTLQEYQRTSVQKQTGIRWLSHLCMLYHMVKLILLFRLLWRCKTPD